MRNGDYRMLLQKSTALYQQQISGSITQMLRTPKWEPAKLRPFRQIEFELASYSGSISEKPRIIVLNKTDLVPDEDFAAEVAAKYEQLGHPVLLVSSLKKEGLRDLVRLLTSRLGEMNKSAEE